MMSILDLDALERAPLQHEPCDFVVVPEFVRPEMLDAVNADYPDIREPGNFDPDGLEYGPVFARLLEELYSAELRQRFSDKFGLDLDPFPLQATVRKYSEMSDGNVHNDSKGKIVTTLIYFNDRWEHSGGRLRLLRSSWDINDYTAEVVPEKGTLISFRRSEKSFHGFEKVEGERRSLQMYWVKPKRAAKGNGKGVGLKKGLKRLLKHRPRFGQRDR